ncbi:hypothetical protein LCGC14_2301880 [marine sediment metagenome]|uniref:Uncharacterized protein n=1 Tax=marine sediment metagenome TaxID=412755 RepID=A0A0F9CNB1_9ZZZZ
MGSLCLFAFTPIEEFKGLLMQKRQPHYEYTRVLKKQSPAVQKMITAGEKPGSGVIKPLTTKKKKLSLLQKTKKRLRKVFGRKE